MATTLMLLDEKAALGGSNPGRGDNKDCAKAMKKAKINGATHKRQPQRGLGVAQLERLRLQEQKKRLQEDTVMAAAAASTNDRMAYVSPYGYGRPPGAYSFLRHHHPHQSKQLSSCSSNRNMFGLQQVACSNHGRSILSAEPVAQLAPSYASILQKYRFCNTEDHPPFMAAGGVSNNSNTNNNHLASMFGGFEEDGRFRALTSHNVYPYGGRPLQSVHKETKSFIYDGQFSETSPRGPFLQSVPVAKVGVPLTVDQPKELSSFQNCHDNSNWYDTAPGIKNNPWYAMQQRQKHAHNLMSALDLKLTAGEKHLGTDNNVDRLGHLNLLGRRSSNFKLRRDTSPVFNPEPLKSFQDFFAESESKEKSLKRPRSEEDLHAMGSKHGADILALTLSTTSASVPDSRTHSLGETDDDSDDTVCEIPSVFQQQIKNAEERSEVPVRTFMFMPPPGGFLKEKLIIHQECPSLLEISGNTASAASTDAENFHSSSGLDLSLKL